MKKRKTIYIGGKMSGLPGFGYTKFHAAEKRLVAAGYRVINPAKLNTAGEPWIRCLRNDIKHIVKHCDGIAVLPNWRYSKGARLEVSIGIQLGMFFICAKTLQSLEITLEQKFRQRRK